MLTDYRRDDTAKQLQASPATRAGVRSNLRSPITSGYHLTPSNVAPINCATSSIARSGNLLARRDRPEVMTSHSCNPMNF